MIWLKKVRKNALLDKDFNIAVYLQEMLEPFDKYLASIKETELTPEIIQDTQFHLYQLMELYIDSRICSRWVTLNPDEKLSSSKTSPEKEDFLDSALSFYLFQGTWSSIRIFPSGPCKYDTILQNNALKPNYDFLNGTLCTFSESLELTPFSNTSEFYKLCAEEAILNFIQLGFYIFGDTAKSKADINNLKSELHDLRKSVDKKPYYNSTVLVVPDFEKYCDFLLKNELLTYNGSCLCRTDN